MLMNGINIIGIGLIVLVIYWFFWIKPKAKVVAGKAITIKVEGGVYDPASIRLRAGEPITLNFLRLDPTPCAATVIFDQLGVSAELPIQKIKAIYFKRLDPGIYHFTCQMQMYRGKLIVE